jgi:hypothetical protein
MFKVNFWEMRWVPRAAILLLGAGCALGAVACESPDAGAEGGEAVTVTKSALLGPAIGPVNHNLQYFFCGVGDQGQNCPIGGPKYVAYGINGSYRFKALNGTQPCNLSTFDGIDPALGVVKNCYFANYGLVASQNGTGHVPAGTEIAYGANGVFNFKKFTTSTFSCNDATFGSPIAGAKACYSAMAGYNRMATQGGTISAGAGSSVAYGANGHFFFKNLTGSAVCDVGTFGGDPAFGFLKDCYQDVLGVPIASEGDPITGSPSTNIVYTSGLDGNDLIKHVETTDVCTFTSMGGDPDLFTPKHCYPFIIIP